MNNYKLNFLLFTLFYMSCRSYVIDPFIDTTPVILSGPNNQTYRSTSQNFFGGTRDLTLNSSFSDQENPVFTQIADGFWNVAFTQDQISRSSIMHALCM